MKNHVSLIFVLWLIMSSASLCADLYIITSKATNINSIEHHDLRNLYLGRTKFIQNEIVQILDHQNDLQNFLEHVVHKSEYSYRSLWKMKIFTGKGKSPKNIESLNELINIISQQSNVIAYTSSFVQDDHPQIKILKHIKIP